MHGKISKLILEEIYTEQEINQWKNTRSAIVWFRNMKQKDNPVYNYISKTFLLLAEVILYFA